MSVPWVMAGGVRRGAVACGQTEIGQDERQSPRCQRACKQMKPGLLIDTRRFDAGLQRAVAALHRALA